MISKLRPNVLILGTAVAALTGYLAVLLIDKTDAIVSNEILALLVGVGLGGLIGVMSAVAQDAPPPTVPAATVEKLIERIDGHRCRCGDENVG